MAYIDFAFYSDRFFGTTIPENAFEKYAERAGDRIDLLTFDRLENGLPENQRSQEKIKKAVCVVAEALFLVDKIKDSNMESVGSLKREDGTITGKVVSSISAGSESISYSSPGNEKNDIYHQAASDIAMENRLIYQLAVSYLHGVTTDEGVGLLYAGL